MGSPPFPARFAGTASEGESRTEGDAEASVALRREGRGAAPRHWRDARTIPGVFEHGIELDAGPERIGADQLVDVVDRGGVGACDAAAGEGEAVEPGARPVERGLEWTLRIADAEIEGRV